MTLKAKLDQKSSWLLAGAGLTGIVLTTISSVKAGMKLERKKEEMKDASVGERVEAHCKILAKPVAIAVGTAVCYTVAVSKSEAKVEKLTGTCLLLEQTFRQYRNKVVEILGEEKEEEIRHEVAIDNAACYDHPTDDDENLQLFYDEMSHRYFNDTLENVRRAENRVNHVLSVQSYVDLNSFYEFLDNEEMPETEEGCLKGWSIYQGSVNYGYLWIDFIHEKVVLDDGMECTYIHVPVEPHVDYLWC